MNINLHWRLDQDTLRMKMFMRRMIGQIEEKAKHSGAHHPYIFLNHCFEEQLPLDSYGKPNIDRLLAIRHAVDPREIFHVLQPGHYKFGLPRGGSALTNYRS